MNTKLIANIATPPPFSIRPTSVTASAPIEILGHGFRWPTAARPEITPIIRKVVECEIGGAAP